MCSCTQFSWMYEAMWWNWCARACSVGRVEAWAALDPLSRVCVGLNSQNILWPPLPLSFRPSFPLSVCPLPPRALCLLLPSHCAPSIPTPPTYPHYPPPPAHTPQRPSFDPNQQYTMCYIIVYRKIPPQYKIIIIWLHGNNMVKQNSPLEIYAYTVYVL